MASATRGPTWSAEGYFCVIFLPKMTLKATLGRLFAIEEDSPALAKGAVGAVDSKLENEESPFAVSRAVEWKGAEGASGELSLREGSDRARTRRPALGFHRV